MTYSQEYKIKQIPKMDILDSRYSRKTRKQRLRCFLVFLEYRESKMFIFGICFILYFLKLSACRGFLQSRLNNIRASNKISRTTVLDRSATRGRTSASWSNNSRQKGNYFLSKGHRWNHNPPKMTFQSRKDTRSKQGQWKTKQQS